MATDALMADYWPDPTGVGYDCLDEFLAAGFSLVAIEAWWEAGIATAEGAQALQAAGIRPAQIRLAAWAWDPGVMDDLLAALAPLSWTPDPVSDTAALGAYDLAASDAQGTVWRDGRVLAEQWASSRDQARRRAEAVMRQDARRRLPRWERLEPAS